MVELDIKIEAGDLYDYMLMHAYNSPGGIMGSALGAVMAVFALMTGQWIFLVGGVLLLLYLPWTLFIKSRRQALGNPAFSQPLHYVLDQEGICISQKELELVKQRLASRINSGGFLSVDVQDERTQEKNRTIYQFSKKMAQNYNKK